MRRLLALLTVMLVLAAACSSDDDGGAAEVDESTTTTSTADDDDADPPPDDDETTTTTTEPAPTGPSPGVTDDAIKLGVTYVDLVSIADVVDIDHGDYEAAYDAVIADINARGGINGRLIEHVFAPINPIGTVAADEACVKLAEDEGVFAVVGFFLADGPLCHVETHETAVIGGSMTDERLGRAKVPWFTHEAGGDLELDGIATFVEEGLLDGAFAVFGIINDEVAYEAARAKLDELGAEPVAEAILDAPPDDQPAQISQTQVIAERFRAEGAETVLVIGSGAVSWGVGVEALDYRPRVLLTNEGVALAYVNDEAGRDLTVLEDAVLAGLAQQDYNEPALQECLAVLADAGIDVPDPDTLPDNEEDLHVSAYNACRMMTLFTAIAEAAGDDLNYGTFRRAGEQLGELTIPGYPDPYVFGPPPSADGDPAIYLYGFEMDAREFVVLG